MKCASCGNGPVEQRTAEHRETHAGVEFTANMPARVCLGCDVVEFEGADLERLELAVALWLSRSGRLEADAFRMMRKALGTPAKQLAELLGVTPETVSRWEGGSIPVDGHAFVIVGGMVADRVADRAETVVRLEALRKPVVVAASVPLNIAEILAATNEQEPRSAYDGVVARMVSLGLRALRVRSFGTLFPVRRFREPRGVGT